MNRDQAVAQLQSEGLRIAKSGEAGWAWVWMHDDGDRVTWWVAPQTDADLLAAAKAALDWLSADESTAWSKPSRESIITQLDAAIAAADPTWVC